MYSLLQRHSIIYIYIYMYIPTVLYPLAADCLKRSRPPTWTRSPFPWWRPARTTWASSSEFQCSWVGLWQAGETWRWQSQWRHVYHCFLSKMSVVDLTCVLLSKLRAGKDTSTIPNPSLILSLTPYPLTRVKSGHGKWCLYNHPIGAPLCSAAWQPSWSQVRPGVFVEGSGSTPQ